MEKNLKKNIYFYLQVSSLHLKLTQHYKSTILQLKNNNKEASPEKEDRAFEQKCSVEQTIQNGPDCR